MGIGSQAPRKLQISLASAGVARRNPRSASYFPGFRFQYGRIEHQTPGKRFSRTPLSGFPGLRCNLAESYTNPPAGRSSGRKRDDRCFMGAKSYY
jgi:hypothetical protein